MVGEGPVKFPRQPDKIVITPSNQSPWIGSVDAPDQRFTLQQLYVLSLAGRDPAQVEAVTVFREATTREMWWPTGSPPPVFQFDCPVVQRLGDGRIKVIAPGGDKKIVLANGWVRMPSRGNRKLLA